MSELLDETQQQHLLVMLNDINRHIFDSNIISVLTAANHSFNVSTRKLGQSSGSQLGTNARTAVAVGSARPEDDHLGQAHCTGSSSNGEEHRTGPDLITGFNQSNLPMLFNFVLNTNRFFVAFYRFSSEDFCGPDQFLSSRGRSISAWLHRFYETELLDHLDWELLFDSELHLSGRHPASQLGSQLNVTSSGPSGPSSQQQQQQQQQQQHHNTPSASTTQSKKDHLLKQHHQQQQKEAQQAEQQSQILMLNGALPVLSSMGSGGGAPVNLQPLSTKEESSLYTSMLNQQQQQHIYLAHLNVVEQQQQQQQSSQQELNGAIEETDLFGSGQLAAMMQQSAAVSLTAATPGRSAASSLLSLPALKDITFLILLITNLFYKLRHSFPALAARFEVSWKFFETYSDQLEANFNHQNLLHFLQIEFTRQKRYNSRRSESLKREVAQLARLSKLFEKELKDLARSCMQQGDKQALETGKSSSTGYGVTYSRAGIANASTTGYVVSSPATDSKTADRARAAISSTPTVSGQLTQGNPMPGRVCPQCGKTFRNAYKLNRHLYVHKDKSEKPFECDWSGCDYRSISHNDLKRHKMIHTGEKPYLCSVGGCEKRYSRPDKLRHHKQTVHFKQLTTARSSHGDAMTTVVKKEPFICIQPGCSFVTAIKADFSLHQIEHSNTQQKERNKFVKPTNLQQMQQQQQLPTQTLTQGASLAQLQQDQQQQQQYVVSMSPLQSTRGGSGVVSSDIAAVIAAANLPHQIQQQMQQQQHNHSQQQQQQTSLNLAHLTQVQQQHSSNQPNLLAVQQQQQQQQQQQASSQSQISMHSLSTMLASNHTNDGNEQQNSNLNHLLQQQTQHQHHHHQLQHQQQQQHQQQPQQQQQQQLSNLDLESRLAAVAAAAAQSQSQAAAVAQLIQQQTNDSTSTQVLLQLPVSMTGGSSGSLHHQQSLHSIVAAAAAAQQQQGPTGNLAQSVTSLPLQQITNSAAVAANNRQSQQQQRLNTVSVWSN